MSAQPNLDLVLQVVKTLDRGTQSDASLEELLEQVLPLLIPDWEYARIYRLSGSRVLLEGGTRPGDDLSLELAPLYSEAVRLVQPAYYNHIWVAPLHVADDIFGFLEVGIRESAPAQGTSADVIRLAAHLLTAPLQHAFVNNRGLALRGDDALTIVQGQYEASGTIFGSETPDEVLKAIHNFAGARYDRAHLALIDDPARPHQLHIVAVVESGTTRPADEYAVLDDYPASEALVALEALTVQDVATDPFLTDAERLRLNEQGILAMVIVPLVVSQRLTGLIVFTHSASTILSPARLRALRNLADQLAVVVENRQLLRDAQAAASQLQRQVHVLETLNVLASGTNVANDEPMLLTQSIEAMVQALDAAHGAILLFHPSEDIAFVASEYPARGTNHTELAMVRNPLLREVETVPVVVDAADVQRGFEPDGRAALQLNRALLLAVPIAVGTARVGLVLVQLDSPDRVFTQEMVDLVSTMSAQMSTILQNIRLITDSQRRADQLQRVASFGQAVQTTLDIESILRVMLVETTLAIAVDRMNIALFDPVQNVLRLVAQYEEGTSAVMIAGGAIISTRGALVGRVWESGEFLHIADVNMTTDMRRTQEAEIRALMIAPIRSRGRSLGIVNVGSLQPHAYSEADIAVFQQMTNQLSIALENAEALAQSQRKAKNESLVNEITTQYQQQLDVHHMLNVTMNELGKALGARRGRIRLATLQPDTSATQE